MFQHVFDVIILLFVALLFLLGFFDLIGSVTKTLHAIIDFLQFHLGHVAGRNDLGYRGLHRSSFPDKIFQLAISLLGDLPPEFVHIVFGELIAIDEVHPRLHFIFGRHEIFDGEGRDI